MQWILCGKKSCTQREVDGIFVLPVFHPKKDVSFESSVPIQEIEQSRLPSPRIEPASPPKARNLINYMSTVRIRTLALRQPMQFTWPPGLLNWGNMGHGGHGRPQFIKERWESGQNGSVVPCMCVTDQCLWGCQVSVVPYYLVLRALAAVIND